MSINLITDPVGNVTNAVFSVGYPAGGVSPESNSGEFTFPAGTTYPIYGFQVDVVGPGNFSSCTFTSGRGGLSYSVASGALAVQDSTTACGGLQPGTGESSNAAYGAVIPASGPVVQQVFEAVGVSMLAAAPLSNGQLQLWAVATNNTLLSEWKTTTSPGAPWSGWQAFPAPGAVRQIAAGDLSDGQPQLWAVTTDNKLFSQWKTTTSPGAPWSGWQAFPASGPVQQIAAGRLRMANFSCGRSQPTINSLASGKRQRAPMRHGAAGRLSRCPGRFSSFSAPCRTANFSCGRSQPTIRCLASGKQRRAPVRHGAAGRLSRLPARFSRLQPGTCRMANLSCGRSRPTINSLASGKQRRAPVRHGAAGRLSRRRPGSTDCSRAPVGWPTSAVGGHNQQSTF